MTRAIVDSSVWIEFLNNTDSPFAEGLARMIEADNVILTRLIRSEILCGFKQDSQFKKASKYLEGFDIVEDGSLVVHARAVEIFRSCRRKGVTVRSLVDCMIAAAALENDLPVMARDRDFEHIANIFPLEVLSSGFVSM